MGNIINLMDNIINFYGNQKQRVFAIYFWDKRHQIIDVTRKTKEQIIELLPKPTPNFICQAGTDKSDVLQDVINQNLDILL